MLLHTCCAPCATAPVERLRAEGFEVILYFSNSNIYPFQEYLLRLQHARRLAERLGLSLVEDVYDHAAWLRHILGLEDEPEGGQRCRQCFVYNLGRSAQCARRLGIPAFTTTLTVSRHKSSAEIFRSGSGFAGFAAIDFKKQNGFTRSLRLSRSLGLYRQSYCGCEFSLKATPCS